MPTLVAIGYTVTSTSLLKSSFVYIVVIIGFNQTEFTVSEDIGQIQLCLVMISPLPGERFLRSFLAVVQTQDGTAIGMF